MKWSISVKDAAKRKRCGAEGESAVEDTPQNSAEILLYDEIDHTGLWGITAKGLINAVQSLGEIQDITLRIHSFGGELEEAQAMYSYMKAHKANVTVMIDGIAASAATVVAMAGDKIIMPSNAIFMIHNPSTHVEGEAEDLRKIAERLDKSRETIVNVYKTKTKLSGRKIRELMDAETWMTADEAKDYGFVDEIEAALPVSACVRNLNDIPAELREKLPVNFLEVTAMGNKKVSEPEPVKTSAEPDVVTSASASASQATNAADFDAIKAAAIESERARMKELDDLMAPGREAIIAKAKYETFADARDIALELLKADGAARALADRRIDAQAVNSVLTPQQPNLSEREMQDRLEAAMAAEVNNFLNGGVR